ncbi:MAG TPA: HlyD family secretion protein [Burkholderiales bacterium]|jgi:membrane fusion protein (multidrug efflux system)|nr:HlyD family secretion protein [Burkholderiales bacterium]
MDRAQEQPSHKVDELRALRSRLPVGAKAWLIGAVAIALLVWGGNWLAHRWTHVYVDDARVDGEVVTISSRVSGWVIELPVIEGDEIKPGQLIAHVDDRDSVLQRDVLLARLKAVESQMAVIRAQTGQVDQETLGKYQSETNRLAAAQADVAAVEANLKQARQDRDRLEGLHKKEYISGQEMERARTAYQQAEENHRKALADVAAVRGMLSAAGGSRKQIGVMQQQLAVLGHQAAEIRAEVQRQEVDIADRTIKSPAEGRIVMTFVRKGEHVAAGQRIAMFHDPKQIWVQANVKETAVGLLKPGMKADVRIDAYPGHVFRGEIYRIGQAATSKFALLPDPNPSGNFTKITQRLPVRILLAEKDLMLRPGMMAEVDIAVGND